MGRLGTFALEFILGWAFNKLTRYYKKTREKLKTEAETKKRVDRVNAAVAAGYNGLELTPEQTKELIDAGRDLIRNY